MCRYLRPPLVLKSRIRTSYASHLDAFSLFPFPHSALNISREMLSPTYHAQCWAVCAAAVALYHGLVSGLGLPRGILDNVLALAGSEAVLQVWDGPHRQPPRLVRLVSTGCLLVSLGAATRHFQVPDVDVARFECVVHALLAFTVLGIVEPIRRNASLSPACRADG